MALLTYRNTPRDDTLGSPSERLMSRKTRSPIPTDEQQLKPHIVDSVFEQLSALRAKQKAYHDRGAKPARQIQVGDDVRLQQGAHDWIGATVKGASEKPRSFIVETADGRTFRRNTSHLHATRAKLERSPDVAAKISECENKQCATAAPAQMSTNPTRTETESAPMQQEKEMTPPLPTAQYVTRSGREVKKVVKMNL